MRTFKILMSGLILLGIFHCVQAQTVSNILDSLQIDTLINSGPKDNRINLAIQNRATPSNNFSGKAEFVQMIQDELYRNFSRGDSLEKPPYAQYRNFYNLYSTWWPNALGDATGWSLDTLKAVRDSLWLPWADTINGWATLLSTTKTGGGGGAGLLRWKRTGEAKIFGMGWETFLHEFGHTMPGLLDEYSSDGSWSGGQCWETPNTTGELLWENIPWRMWIDKSTPLPTPYTGPYLNTIGAFEGAMTNFFGCHRPSARGCIMGAGGFGEGYGLQLCPPCVQRIICFTYKYVDVIENPVPATSSISVAGAQTVSFRADVVRPFPNTQTYQWLLNGKEIANGVDSVEVTFGNCDAYELTFVVLDTNPLVRYDPKFEETYPRPIETHTWNIDQTTVGSYNLLATASGQAPDCSGETNGEVSFTISGGSAPYQVIYEGLVTTNPVQNLAAGAYDYHVVDANGCGVPATATVNEAVLLEPRMCSSHNGSTWSIEVSDDNYSPGSLTYLWSTGATTQAVSGLPNGTYSVAVTTASLCTVSDTVTLSPSAIPLSVSATVIPSDATGVTGKIYLEIAGGSAPYSVSWYDNPYVDLTDADTSKIDASGTTWGHLPEFAYDDNLSTKFLHFNPPTTVWNSYEFTTSVAIQAYSITSADDVPSRDPKDWVFEGSFNGTSWTVLDAQVNVVFGSRFEKQSFPLNNQTSYSHYRLNVLANQGDLATQVEELEYIGADPNAVVTENVNERDKISRVDLPPGTYVYIVSDTNNTCIRDTIQIGMTASFVATGLSVVKDGNCGVRIDIPDPNHTYYWFSDEGATNLLNTGNSFYPDLTGNYYVGAQDLASGGLSSNIKGFAVNVEPEPDSVYMGRDTVFIVNPQANTQYYWYGTDSCDAPIDSGTYFLPGLNPGNFYVAARSTNVYPTPIDPASLSGIVMHMDAADMDGDNTIDDPQWVSGSLYDWIFRTGPNWTNNWFAYRGNYQNGLGIADFATIWLQGLDASWSGFQSILMVYKENALSMPNTSPYERMSDVIPRHSDATQLFANSTPIATLSGKTFLNGEIVNPLSTPNPMEFCVLGVVPTVVNNGWFNYNDEHWEGQLAELVLFNGTVSDSLMQGASEYLRQKWISTADLQSPRLCFTWTPCINPAVVTNSPTAVCSPACHDLTAAAITAGSTPDFTFTYWSDPTATAALPTPETVCTQGTYYIVGSSTVGCADTAAVFAEINPVYSLNESATICQGETYTFPDLSTSSTAVVHTNLLLSSSGCDSTITTTLTVTPLDTSVTTAGMTLTSGHTASSNYQWIDCSNGNSPVFGATAQSYFASSPGRYAVIVSNNLCTDTSDCYTVTDTEVENLADYAIEAYPNPTTGALTIDFGRTLAIDKALVVSSLGRIVREVNNVVSKELKFDLTTESNGVYFIRILTPKSAKQISFVKEK